jgi:ABC-type phosphate/phosphonate transport system substrate-binding protein
VGLIASLPMYDWPERRAEVDADWAAIRDCLRERSVAAPPHLTRDVGTAALWRRPDLLLSQTCWGPLELGLAEYVEVVGQPSYSGIEGGDGELYSSAIVMRALSGRRPADAADIPAIPVELLRGARFAFNTPDSMSGVIGLTRDLEAVGEGLDIFAGDTETGGHRGSLMAVAEGRADVAAIDCRSWHLAQRFEPAARKLQVVGWTARRKGLPFITARNTPAPTVAALREALSSLAASQAGS